MKKINEIEKLVYNHEELIRQVIIQLTKVSKQLENQTDFKEILLSIKESIECQEILAESAKSICESYLNTGEE